MPPLLIYDREEVQAVYHFQCQGHISMSKKSCKAQG